MDPSLSAFMKAVSRLRPPVVTQVIDGDPYTGFKGTGFLVSPFANTDRRGFIKKEVVAPALAPERSP